MPSVLISGCDTGIGREFARQYSRAGWQVYATYRDLANRLPAAEADGTISHHSLDVTRPEDFIRLKDELAEKTIDVLLSNAGIGHGLHHFGATDYDYLEQMWRVNTVGPLRLCETFATNVEASALKKIAVVSSRMGSVSLNNSGAHYGYRSSKAGLNAMLKSMALDLFERGILVVALHPGWVRTQESNAALSASQSVAGMRKVIARLGAHETGQFYNYNGAPLAW